MVLFFLEVKYRIKNNNQHLVLKLISDQNYMKSTNFERYAEVPTCADLIENCWSKLGGGLCEFDSSSEFVLAQVSIKSGKELNSKLKRVYGLL